MGHIPAMPIYVLSLAASLLLGRAEGLMAHKAENSYYFPTYRKMA